MGKTTNEFSMLIGTVDSFCRYKKTNIIQSSMQDVKENHGIVTELVDTDTADALERVIASYKL